MEQKKRERTEGKKQNKMLEHARMKAMSKASQRQWGKQQGKQVEQLTAIERYPEKKRKKRWTLRRKYSVRLILGPNSLLDLVLA